MQGSVRGGVGCVRAVVSAAGFGVRGRGGRGNLGTWRNVAAQAAICLPLPCFGRQGMCRWPGEGLFIRLGTSSGALRSSSDPGGRGTGCGSRQRELDGLGASILGAELLFYCCAGRAWRPGGRAMLRWDNVRRDSVEFRPRRRRFGARSAMQRAQ